MTPGRDGDVSIGSGYPVEGRSTSASNSAVRATSAFPASMTIAAESLSVNASPPVTLLEEGSGTSLGSTARWGVGPPPDGLAVGRHADAAKETLMRTTTDINLKNARWRAASRIEVIVLGLG